MSNITTTPGRTVRLSKVALTYLVNTKFLSAELDRILSAAAEAAGGECILKLDPDTAERFRDEFTSRLASVGFDADYEPTREGELLEELIDQFAK
ncbi:MAG: hypothetical protein MUF80_00755 [Burkholderiales bacterium]|jgi:hypothetical protein|nr:hypothetical protein [Burkholderiales bacterium]